MWMRLAAWLCRACFVRICNSNSQHKCNILIEKSIVQVIIQFKLRLIIFAFWRMNLKVNVMGHGYIRPTDLYTKPWPWLWHFEAFELWDFKTLISLNFITKLRHFDRAAIEVRPYTWAGLKQRCASRIRTYNLLDSIVIRPMRKLNCLSVSLTN